jgi:hypothetical protein
VPTVEAGPINWLLINLGNAVQWLWGAIQALFAWLGGILELLSPVLSPVIGGINRVLTVVMDAAYAVLAPLPAWLGLTILSVLCGVFMIVVFRFISNQEAIGRARDRMTAQMLALKLFKDDLGVAFRAQRRLFAQLVWWQWLMLRPMILLILLLLPFVAQMATRYEWRPLRPGEQTIVTLQFPDSTEIPPVRLAASPGIANAVGPVPGGGQLVWRLEAGKPGRYQLEFDLGDRTVSKEFVVSEQRQRVSAERPGRHWMLQLIHPVEPALPTAAGLRFIRIDYPGIASYVDGSGWWILHFFVVSMIAALAMLPFFKVRF